MMTSFDPENIGLGPPNFQLKKFLHGLTFPPNFLFLALTEAETAAGKILPLPPPGRVILTLSAGKVLTECMFS